MKPRIGLREVAERVGVSKTAVSYVLSGRENCSVSQDTRQRIMEAAQVLGYRPNGIARSLVLGKTQTIGVLTPSLDDPFTADMVTGIQEEAEQRDFRVLLAHCRRYSDAAAKQARLLLEQRVDGLICLVNGATMGGREGCLAEALHEGVACVAVGDRVPELAVDHVLTDEQRGARTAVEHLAGLGHRQIGFLGIGDGREGQARQAGYREGLEAAAIELDEPFVVIDSLAAGTPIRSSEALLDLPHPPTALFAAHDSLAAMAVGVALQRGVRVPEGLAVLGFGDLRAYWYLQLTTVRLPGRSMGQQAARRLFQRLAQPLLPAEEILVPATLVRRATCGRAASRYVSRDAARRPQRARLPRGPLSTAPSASP